MSPCARSETIEISHPSGSSVKTTPLLATNVCGEVDSVRSLSTVNQVPSWLLAVIDQAIVSGTRFATTIFLGRAAGAVELGHYSIAFMTFLALGCLQEALVTTPYAIHCHRLR